MSPRVRGEGREACATGGKGVLAHFGQVGHDLRQELDLGVGSTSVPLALLEDELAVRVVLRQLESGKRGTVS